MLRNLFLKKNQLKGLFKKEKNQKFLKQVFLSSLSGVIIFIATWFYSNSSFTLRDEERLNEKISLIRPELFKPNVPEDRKFIFINTGSDLALIKENDKSGKGNMVIADREKILELIRHINNSFSKPRCIIIDLLLEDSFLIRPQIDDSLSKELNKANAIIAVRTDEDGNIVPLLLDYSFLRKGLTEYTTYGYILNKFKLYSQADIKPIPLIVYNTLDTPKYSSFLGLDFCDGYLYFKSLWPLYYFNSKDSSNFFLNSEYSDSSKENMEKYRDKILIIGDLKDDLHPTAIGDLPGSMILANTYLSLHQRQHIVCYVWLVMMIFIFSLLSYYSWFKKVPKVHLASRYYYIDKLFKKISDNWWGIFNWGILSLTFIFSIILFHSFVSLIFPGLIFSLIEFFSIKNASKERKR